MRIARENGSFCRRDRDALDDVIGHLFGADGVVEIEHQVRGNRLMPGNIDPDRIGGFRLFSLCVQPLRIAVLYRFERHPQIAFEIAADFFAVPCQLLGIGIDHRHDHQHFLLRQEPSEALHPHDLLAAIRFGMAEIVAETGADAVPVQQDDVAAILLQLADKGRRQRCLARSRQAG